MHWYWQPNNNKEKIHQTQNSKPSTNKLTPVKHQTHRRNPKQFICKTCSYQCEYDCAQLCYTIQHRTVLIIFPFILQTIIIAQMLSNGGEGTWKGDNIKNDVNPFRSLCQSYVLLCLLTFTTSGEAKPVISGWGLRWGIGWPVALPLWGCETMTLKSFEICLRNMHFSAFLTSWRQPILAWADLTISRLSKRFAVFEGIKFSKTCSMVRVTNRHSIETSDIYSIRHRHCLLQQ